MANQDKSQKNVDPFDAGLIEKEQDITADEIDQAHARMKVDNPQHAATDLPAIHSTTGGMPTQFMWITTMVCPACKHSRLGILKDLGGGSLTAECEAPDCRQTVHLLVSMLPRDDQIKHSKLTMRRY